MQIKISNLEFKTIIGILKHERVTPQKVIINLSCSYIFSKDNFIDYSHIVSYVKKSMRTMKFQLIEDAIIYFEENLVNKFDISNLKIEIIKPTIINNCQVSISNIE